MIVPFPGPDAEPDIEQVIKEYPRQQAMHYLRTMWQSGAMPICPTTQQPVTLRQLMDGFAAYRRYCVTNQTPWDKIRKVATYMTEFGWLDDYSPPKAPVEPPNAARDRIVAKMRDDAAGGSRFARDWLRREGLA